MECPVNFPHHNRLAQASFLPRNATFLLNVFLMSSMERMLPGQCVSPISTVPAEVLVGSGSQLINKTAIKVWAA